MHTRQTAARRAAATPWAAAAALRAARGARRVAPRACPRASGRLQRWQRLAWVMVQPLAAAALRLWREHPLAVAMARRARGRSARSSCPAAMRMRMAWRMAARLYRPPLSKAAGRPARTTRCTSPRLHRSSPAMRRCQGRVLAAAAGSAAAAWLIMPLPPPSHMATSPPCCRYRAAARQALPVPSCIAASRSLRRLLGAPRPAARRLPNPHQAMAVLRRPPWPRSVSGSVSGSGGWMALRRRRGARGRATSGSGNGSGSGTRGGLALRREAAAAL